MATRGIRGSGWLLAGAAAAALTLASAAQADTMTLQYNTVGSGYQGQVDSVTGATAAGYTSTFQVLGPATGTQSVGLVRFDDNNGTGIGTIPANSHVDSATLTLTLYSVVTGGGTLYVSPVTSGWTASGVVSPMPTINTGTAVGSTIPGAEPNHDSIQLSYDITSLVQSWVDGTANDGVALYAETNRGVKIRSANQGYDGIRAPLLTINYTPTAVPEPASLALGAVGLAGVGLLKRRARRL